MLAIGIFVVLDRVAVNTSGITRTFLILSPCDFWTLILWEMRKTLAGSAVDLSFPIIE